MGDWEASLLPCQHNGGVFNGGLIAATLYMRATTFRRSSRPTFSRPKLHWGHGIAPGLCRGLLLGSAHQSSLGRHVHHRCPTSLVGVPLDIKLHPAHPLLAHPSAARARRDHQLVPDPVFHRQVPGGIRARSPRRAQPVWRPAKHLAVDLPGPRCPGRRVVLVEQTSGPASRSGCPPGRGTRFSRHPGWEPAPPTLSRDLLGGGAPARQ